MKKSKKIKVVIISGLVLFFIVAAVPGRYTAPASRAYLYYGDEHKQWAAPVKVEITPAQ